MQERTSESHQDEEHLSSGPAIPPEEVEAELRRILASPIFRKAPRHSRFLNFVSRKALDGSGDSVKEYLIGLEVFDREPDYDPGADPVVRVEAGRLRSRLADYYRKIGRYDPIRIDLPKGTYVPVFRGNTIASDGVTVDPGHAGTDVLLEATQKRPPRPSRRKTLLALVLMGGITLSAASFYVLVRKKPRNFGSPAPSSPIKVRRSVAVLGFENLSKRPDKDWLSNALSEMLGTEIGANGKLRSIPGEEVARATTELQLSPHDGLSKDTLSRLGRNLNADLAVSGAYTILPAPDSRFDQVRFELCLQDANTGETVATRAFTGSTADLFSLVASAGSSLRQDLNVEPVSPDEAAQARAAAPSNVEAARLYAEGLIKLRNFDPLGARPLLQRAAAIDPSFPFVHLALADVYDFLDDDEGKRNSATKAYEASSHLSREEQLHIKARYEEAQHHWEDAAATYRALVAFFPDNIEYGLGLVYAEITLGERTDALRTLDRLHKLPPPLSADPRIDLAEAKARAEMSDFRQALVPATRAAQEAKARGARLLYAHALLRQAGLLTSMGDYAPAIPVDEEARTICAQLGDQSCVAAVYRRIGNRKIDTDPQGAEQAFRQALIIARQTGSKSEEANDLNGLAAVLSSEGHYTAAGRIYRPLLADAREQHKVSSIQMFLNDLGEVEIAQGHLSEAKKMEEEAVMVSRQSGQKVGIADGLMDIAYILQLEGDLGGAEKDYKEAIEIFRAIGMKGHAAVCEAGLAAIARDRGELSAASDEYQEALGVFSYGGKDDGSIADARLGLARVYIDQQLAEKAVLLAQQAVAAFNRQKRPDDEGRARAVLAEALLANGAIEDAAVEAKRAAAVLPKSEGRVPHLFVSVALAHVIAVTDQKRNPQNLALDLHRLELAASQAQSLNLVPLALEARLARDTIEFNASRPGSLAQLRTLESEARSRGLLLIARKAQAAANAAVYSASTVAAGPTH